MLKGFKILCLFTALSIFFGGCAVKPKEGVKVLAKVDGGEITLGDVDREIKKMPEMYRYYYENIEGKKKELLEEMINRELLLQEAYKRKIDKREEVIAKLEEFKNQYEDYKKQVLLETLVVEEMKGKGEVTDAEAKAYYEGNKDKFNPKGAKPAPYDNLSAQVKEFLSREKRIAFFKGWLSSLKSKAKVTLNEENLKLLEKKPPQVTPATPESKTK